MAILIGVPAADAVVEAHDALDQRQVGARGRAGKALQQPFRGDHPSVEVARRETGG